MVLYGMVTGTQSVPRPAALTIGLDVHLISLWTVLSKMFMWNFQPCHPHPSLERWYSIAGKATKDQFCFETKTWFRSSKDLFMGHSETSQSCTNKSKWSFCNNSLRSDLSFLCSHYARVFTASNAFANFHGLLTVNPVFYFSYPMPQLTLLLTLWVFPFIFGELTIFYFFDTLLTTSSSLEAPNYCTPFLRFFPIVYNSFVISKSFSHHKSFTRSHCLPTFNFALITPQPPHLNHS